ncbi:50S ribosomal protein L6 [Patescibacteria group bacterium]|nr:50S ribosomal protein L6 [Patescibacteria group bacterium]MBU1034506.1 50S ribosomal protein L6 [Patescibacteria group bacterium]MBU1630002.1 50S ribosomal protein L6 [Patescibacteria group bacterium]
MSRIGKNPIQLPNGVDATVGESSVSIKGPKGVLVVNYPSSVKIEKSADSKSLLVSVSNPEAKDQRALWGLFRQLVNNSVKGVTAPFEKSLELSGVGFKVSIAGRDLNLEVGFSHPVVFKIPDGIEAKVDKQVITISGIDKHLVGETAARIRRIRPPEPYKGKGIKYTTEIVKRKAGKTAAKSA